MPGHDQKTTRVQVEVNGFTWRVYGARTGLRWHCHLVELLGGERLDVPLNQKLLQQMREAVARHLNLEVTTVARIAADLILA